LVAKDLQDGSAAPGNQPPSVVTQASATPNPIAGTTTNLSVLGSDDGGSLNLTYSWSVSSAPLGAANPNFSANGTNAAQNTIVTFHSAGSYTFQVTITDSGGLAATSSVTVTVTQTSTSLALSPVYCTLAPGGTQQFTATVSDQFGNPMSAQPAFTWSLTGIGALGSSGKYTAPGSTGTAAVQAAGGGLAGTASVTVSSLPAAPTNLVATAASSHQVNLAWQESSTNLTGFIIQRSPDKSRWTQLASVSAATTTYMDTTVNRRKTYYYRVCATNSLGSSAWSNVVSVVTPSLGILQSATLEDTGALLAAEGAASSSRPKMVGHWGGSVAAVHSIVSLAREQQLAIIPVDVTATRPSFCPSMSWFPRTSVSNPALEEYWAEFSRSYWDVLR
jgi:hypothetical protein